MIKSPPAPPHQLQLGQRAAQACSDARVHAAQAAGGGGGGRDRRQGGLGRTHGVPSPRLRRRAREWMDRWCMRSGSVSTALRHSSSTAVETKKQQLTATKKITAEVWSGAVGWLLVVVFELSDASHEREKRNKRDTCIGTDTYRWLLVGQHRSRPIKLRESTWSKLYRGETLENSSLFISYLIHHMAAFSLVSGLVLLRRVSAFWGEQTSALFDAAKKAEDQITSLSEEEDRNRLSKGGFFMLCALGTANFSRVCTP